MKKIIIAFLVISFCLFSSSLSFAHSGCCSSHGGVSGCKCADGTALSETCLPYYPECSGNQQNAITPTTQTQVDTPTSSNTYVPVVQITTIPSPALTNIPTVTPTITPKPTQQKIIPTKKIVTPIPPPQTNFFSSFLGGLFSFFFGNHTSTTAKVTAPSSGTNIAGVSSTPSQCKAIHVDQNNPQAYLPDANCTPGSTNTVVTQANIFATICVSGYTKTIRPPASYTNKLKKQQIQAYGYTDTNPSDYEEDHDISLELGGNPTDPKNLWPEPHASINEKDKVENYLHKQVCDGNITLTQAQNEISKNWYAAYQQIQ